MHRKAAPGRPDLTGSRSTGEATPTSPSVSAGKALSDRLFPGNHGDGFGRTVVFKPNGGWRYLDDLAAYEAEHNPDSSPVPDSNPYGILAGRAVGWSWTPAVTTCCVFGPTGASRRSASSRPVRRVGSTDSVPTAVAVGPDGAYYVGELTGGPFPEGEANVYRVVSGEPPVVFAAGFTAIIDIGWGPDGRLYVLQFASGPGLSGPGVLLRVNADGSRTPVVEDRAIAPGGFTFGPDGALYV